MLQDLARIIIELNTLLPYTADNTGHKSIPYQKGTQTQTSSLAYMTFCEEYLAQTANKKACSVGRLVWKSRLSAAIF